MKEKLLACRKGCQPNHMIFLDVLDKKSQFFWFSELPLKVPLMTKLARRWGQSSTVLIWEIFRRKLSLSNVEVEGWCPNHPMKLLSLGTPFLYWKESSYPWILSHFWLNPLLEQIIISGKLVGVNCSSVNEVTVGLLTKKTFNSSYSR